MSLSTKISTWWKTNAEKYYVEESSGTLVHKIASVIHLIAKLTFPVSILDRKIRPAKITLNPMLKAALKAKIDLYKSLLPRHQDLSTGFIMHQECDSLLFSSLLSATGVEIDIASARDNDGWWHRRSQHLPECYRCTVEGMSGSRSTISRDMMTGLMWHMYCRKDKKMAEDLYQHLKSHSFVMGKGDPARLILMPGLEAQLCNIIHKLGGKNHWFSRNQLSLYPKTLTGYEVHLLMLSSLLDGLITGSVPARALAAYKSYATKNKQNPLHQLAYHLYTDGNMDDVAMLLLDGRLWPNHRLPKRGDRRNDWLNSRDCDESYLPAIDGDLEQEHTGGDFIFAAWLILEVEKTQ